MSDESDVNRLLEDFQKALDILNSIDNIESVITKLDETQNRKFLKKVKHVVNEVHGKIENVREKVSRAYKRVRTRSSSAAAALNDRNDVDTEAALPDPNPSFVQKINQSGRFSPVIGDTCKRKTRSDKSEECDTDRKQTKTDDQVQDSDVINDSMEQDVDDDSVIESSLIVSSTPKKSVKKLCISLKKPCKTKDSPNNEENDKQTDGVEETNSNVSNGRLSDDVDVLPPSSAAEQPSNEKEGEKENNVKKRSMEDKSEASKESDKSKNIDLDDSSVTGDGNKEDKPKEDTNLGNTEVVAALPKIKVVDIGKLLEPKQEVPLDATSPSRAKKSVTFGNSVIILSSSDEDTPKRKPKENECPLKSAMKPSPKVLDLSDSDTKENNTSKPKQQKKKLNSDCDDNSDSEEEDSRSRRTRNHERKLKSKFSSLVRERSDRKTRYEKRSVQVEACDDEPKRKAKSKHTRKKEIPTYSDSDSDGKNDPKLKRSVFISLPKFKCEDLPDLYKRKMEAFEIKSGSKKGNRDGKEKKGIKLTLKINKKDIRVSSDEEHSSTEEDKGESEPPKECSVSKEQDKEASDAEVNPEKGESEAKSSKERGEEPNSDDDAGSNMEKDDVERSGEEAEEEKTDKSKKKDTKQTGESSDSDLDFNTFSKKKDKAREELVRKAKRRTKVTVISDSDSDDDDKENNKDSDDDFKAKSNSSSDSDEKGQEEEEEKKSGARKRIKRVKDSSSDDEDKSTRKQIRKMIDRDSLSETTKKAEQEEKERKLRIAEKQKKYNQIFELKADATVDKVVLDFDEASNEPLLSVNKKLVKHLKPHQVKGVKFMWDACFESLKRAKKSEGSGCILAHCMGLGKTLQVIALTHTLLTNQSKSKVEKVMVVCPVNTVLNWKNEYKKWMPKGTDIEVYELVSCKTSSINHERSYIVREWHENGGVLIIGYNMFRNLSNPDNKTISKKLKKTFQEGLVDPGPDLIVCDEGHLLKNEKTNLSIAMNRVKTLRRIVLTGTPLQNNLREYWCMVQFIKPNLLGTYKEYLNRFVNPITNGQYTDSTPHDIDIMRRRSHVLHKLLDGVVQRQDYAVLAPYLPPKYEYVIFLQLTEVQVKLYRHYMDNFARKGDGSNRTSFLFTDFQELQRICTHPRVLLDKSLEEKSKKFLDEESDSEGSLKDFIDDGSEDCESTGESGSSGSESGSDASIKSNEKKRKRKKKDGGASSSTRKRLTRAQAAQKRVNGEESESDVEISGPKQWWEEYISKDELDNINHSSKIFLLFEILKECEQIGDKVLVFSQSLYTLNCIEYFLRRIDDASQKGETESVGGHSGSWAIGLDYFRLDGSSSCDNRSSWCDQFNDPENTRARLFLISTKAGGLGINLVAANRVIIFDVSWNPSHDIQSIYRVYRFGQNKPSYIYRFVTYGAMEMKIYERQVTKQAISKRVIDEQQIDRHYSQNDIQELYKTDLKPADRPIPLVPKDVLLGEMLHTYDKTIYKYHEHQSLLENKQDEQLNEEERKAAWEEFENEKVLRKTSVANLGVGFNAAALQSSMNFSPQLIQLALHSIVRKDNPAWSEVQIRGILPALVAQLQMQMSENDFSMYNRVQQEIRLMQALQQQRMRENYLSQYRQLMQKQHLNNSLLGSLNVTPEEIRRLQMMAVASQNFGEAPQAGAAGTSKDVIELND